MSIDQMVSAAVAGAHLLEKAVHEPDGWQIGWGPFRVPAMRVVHEDRVVFHASVPSSFGAYEPLVALYNGDELQSVRLIPKTDPDGRKTGSVPFEIAWELAVGQQPIAA